MLGYTEKELYEVLEEGNNDFLESKENKANNPPNLTFSNKSDNSQPKKYSLNENKEKTVFLGDPSKILAEDKKTQTSSSKEYQNANSQKSTSENSIINDADSNLNSIDDNSRNELNNQCPKNQPINENFEKSMNINCLKKQSQTEIKIEPYIANALFNYLLFIQDIAKEVDEKFEIFNIDILKNINPLTIIDMNIKEIYQIIGETVVSNKNLDLENKINELAKKEKEKYKCEYSLIEALFKLKAKELLEMYIQNKPFIFLGNKMKHLKDFKIFENDYKHLNDDMKEKIKREIRKLIRPKFKKDDEFMNSQHYESLEIRNPNIYNKKERYSDLNILYENNETTNSSGEMKIFKISNSTQKGHVPNSDQLVSNEKKRKDHLREKTVRKCLKGINKYLEFLIKRIEKQIKDNKKNKIKVKELKNKRKKLKRKKYKLLFWNAHIPDKIVSNLNLFEIFVKKNLMTIYMNVNPKKYKDGECPERLKIKNRKKIKRLFKMSKLKDSKELGTLKILLSLRFSEILKKYVENKNYINVEDAKEGKNYKLINKEFHTIKDDFNDNIERRINVVKELINGKIKHKNKGNNNN